MKRNKKVDHQSTHKQLINILACVNVRCESVNGDVCVWKFVATC